MANRDLGNISISVTTNLESVVSQLNSLGTALRRFNQLSQQAKAEIQRAFQPLEKLSVQDVVDRTLGEKFGNDLKQMTVTVSDLTKAISTLTGGVSQLEKARRQEARTHETMIRLKQEEAAATKALATEEERLAKTKTVSALAKSQQAAAALFQPSRNFRPELLGVLSDPFGLRGTVVGTGVGKQAGLFSRSLGLQTKTLIEEFLSVADQSTILFDKNFRQFFQNIGAVAARVVKQEAPHLRRQMVAGLRQTSVGLGGLITPEALFGEATSFASRFHTFFGQLAQVSQGVTRRTRQGFIPIASPVGEDEVRQIERAHRASERLTKSVRGLLGLRTEGNLFERLFGNFTEGLDVAVAVLVRFQAARVILQGLSQSFTTLATAGAQFEDQMAQVRAIVGATDDDMLVLSEAARKMGRETIISGAEAAKGLQILAQAGFSAKEAAEALPAVMALAVGGVSSLDQAAQILTSTLRAFELGTERADDVSNTLVATVNKSKATIEDLNVAFNFAGTTAADVGLPFQDLAAAVGTLADNGVRASTQGTAVRQVLGALLEPTSKAEAIFEKLGIELSEINPLTNDLVTVLQTLRDKGFGTGEAFQAFDRRVASSVAILINQADQVAELRDRITGTNAAFEAMEARQQSLSAQTTRLVNNFKDLGIALTEDGLSPLAALTSAVADLIGTLAQSPEFIQSLVVIGAGLAGLRIAAGAVATLTKHLDATLAAARLIPTVFGAATAATAAQVAPVGRLAVAWRLLLNAFNPTVAVITVVAGLIAIIAHLVNQHRKYREEQRLANQAAVDASEANRRVADSFERASQVYNDATQSASAHRQALLDMQTTVAQLIVSLPQLAESLKLTTDVTAINVDELRQALVEAPLQARRAQIRATAEVRVAQAQDRNRAFTQSGAGELFSLGHEIAQIERDMNAQLAALDAEINKVREVGSAVRIIRKEIADLATAGQLQEAATRAASATRQQFEELAAALGLTNAQVQQFVADLDTVRATKGGTGLTPEEVVKAAEKFTDLSDRQKVLAQRTLSFVGEIEDALGKGAQARVVESADLDAKVKQQEKLLEGKEKELALTQRVAELVRSGVAETEARRIAAQEVLNRQIAEAERKQQETLNKAASAKPADLGRLKEQLRLQELGLRGLLLERQKLVAEAESKESKQGSKFHSDMIRAAAERAVKEQLALGQIEKAAEIRYASEAAAAREMYAGVALQQKLADLAAEKSNFILEERIKLYQNNLEVAKAVHQERVQQLQAEAAVLAQQRDLDTQLALRAGAPKALTEAASKRAAIEADIALQQRIQADTQQHLNTLVAIRQQTLSELGVTEGQIASLNNQALIDNLKAQQAAEKELGTLGKKTALLQKQLALVEDAGDVFINVGDSLTEAIDDAFQAAILRTGELSDVWNGLWTSFAKQATRAFAQVLTEKLGFDKAFNANIFKLGENFTGVFAKVGNKVFDGLLSKLLDSFMPAATDALGALAGQVGRFFSNAAGGEAGYLRSLGQVVPQGVEILGPSDTFAGDPAFNPNGQATAGAAATIAGIAALVTALVSNLKDMEKQLSDLKRVSHGADPGAIRSLRAANLVNTAVFAGAGAAAGAAVGAAFFGVGAIPGALIGGAIGTFIGQTINRSINNSIEKGVKAAVRDGLTNEDIREDLANSTIAKLTPLGLDMRVPDAVRTANAVFNPLGFLITELILNGIPDIEQIFDKLFRERFASTEFRTGINLEERTLTPAQSSRRQAFFQPGTQGSRDLNDLILLATSVIGAGNLEDRMARFFNMLADNVAVLGKTGEDMEKLVFQLVRAATDANFSKGLNLIEHLFRPEQALRTAQFRREVNLLARAFQEFQPAIDLRGLAEFATTDAGFFRSEQSLRRSRKAVKESLPSLFGAENFDLGFEQFTDGLKQAFQDAFVKGLSKQVILRGPVAAAMGELFRLMQGTFRRAVREGGLSDEERQRLEDRLIRAGQKTANYLALVKDELQRNFELAKEVAGQIDALLRTPTEAALEYNQLIEEITNSLYEAVLAVDQFRHAAVEASIRLQQKIFESGGGEGQAPGVREQGLVELARQRDYFVERIAAFGADVQAAYLENFEGAVDGWLSAAVDGVQQFYAKAIEAAQAAREVFETAKSALLSLRTSRQDASPEAKLTELGKEIAAQREIMLTGEPEEQIKALRRLVDLYNQQAALANEAIDPASPFYRQLLSSTEQGLSEVSDHAETLGMDLEALQASMEEEIRAVKLQAQEYYQFIYERLPALYETQATEAEARVQAIIKAITGDENTDLPTVLETLRTKSIEELRLILENVRLAIVALNPGNPQQTPDPTAQDFWNSGRIPGVTEPIPTEVRRDNPTRQRALALLGEGRLVSTERVLTLLRSAMDSIVGANANPERQAAAEFLKETVAQSITTLRGYVPATIGFEDVTRLVLWLRNTLQFYAGMPSFRHWLPDRIDNVMTAFWRSVQENLPGLAKGGVVTQDVVRRLGEEGPEAVLPLTHMAKVYQMMFQAARAVHDQQAMMGAQAAQAGAGEARTIININPGAIQVAMPTTDEKTVRRVSRQIMDEMLYSMRFGKLGKAVDRRVGR